jgi:hypothetical protein
VRIHSENSFLKEIWIGRVRLCTAAQGTKGGSSFPKPTLSRSEFLSISTLPAWQAALSAGHLQACLAAQNYGSASHDIAAKICRTRDINRSLLVVRPKQPFFDWIQSVDYDAGLTLERIRNDPQTYLVPEYIDDGDITEVLEWGL